MSYTETHVGKLRQVEIPEGGLEAWCKERCLELGKTEIPSYYDSWQETLRGEAHEKYFFHRDAVWEAFDHIESEPDSSDIYHMEPNADGTLTFVMQFYNGGTCLGECIEEGLERLHKGGDTP